MSQVNNYPANNKGNFSVGRTDATGSHSSDDISAKNHIETDQRRGYFLSKEEFPFLIQKIPDKLKSFSQMQMRIINIKE